MSAKATFGAGCFWGVEMRFREIPGVVDAAVGYMGGHVDNPTYRQVCSDQTGHAEVCQVEFDPERVDYEALVRAFFELHDPTQRNRQGADFGSQYRSVVFAHDDDQRQAAERVKSEVDASGRFRAPVVTSIEPAAAFWPAEDYHQQYLARNSGSCAVSGH